MLGKPSVGMMGRFGRLSFVGVGGGSNLATSATAIPYPAGTQPGDVAFLFSDQGSNPRPPSTSGWSIATPSVLGGWMLVYYKTLTLADLSATVTMVSTPNNLSVHVFRGVASVNLKVSEGDASGGGSGGASQAVSGFVKTAKVKGLFLLSGANATANRGVTSPTLANLLASPAGGMPLGTTNYPVSGWYDFNPAEYADSTGLTIDFGTASWSQRSVTIFELM